MACVHDYLVLSISYSSKAGLATLLCHSLYHSLLSQHKELWLSLFWPFFFFFGGTEIIPSSSDSNKSGNTKENGAEL